jgi:3-dehydroquinate synthetase
MRWKRRPASPIACFSDRLLHGEAVSIGMALAFQYSANKGLSSQADAERVVRHLSGVGLPVKISEFSNEKLDADRLMDLIAQDKKVKRGTLTFILVRGIGKSFIANNVDPGDIREFLSGKLAGL